MKNSSENCKKKYLLSLGFLTTCKLLLQDVDDFEFFFSCVVKSKKDWLHFIVKKTKQILQFIEEKTDFAFCS